MLPHADRFVLTLQPDELVWLKLDQSLPEQGVREHQSLVFRKKFFVTDMLVTANQPALLHLLLLEVRQ